MKMYVKYNKLITLFIWIELFSLTETAEVQEYCPGETFKPSCNNNDVIIIEKALYGRMSLGRCVTIDIGYCASNVLSWMDQKCSGQIQCEIKLPDFDLNQQISCKKELTPYLEASYRCTPVVQSRKDSCIKAVTIPVSSRHKSISSRTSLETGCGLPESPWSLQARPGQQINITLLDFNWKEEKSSVQFCKIKYGYIIDVDTGELINICGGDIRTKALYVSKANLLQIVLKEEAIEKQSFLLQFHAMGCADFNPPKNAWLSQEGSKITVGCHGSEEKWELKCKGTTWEGHIGSCPEDPINVQHVMANEEDSTIPHVISLSLIGGMTLVICCISITTITVYFCYRKYKTSNKESDYYATSTIRPPGGDHMTLPVMPHGTIISVRSVRPNRTQSTSGGGGNPFDTLSGQVTGVNDQTNMIDEVIYDDPANLESTVQYMNQFNSINSNAVGNSLQYTKLQKYNAPS